MLSLTSQECVNVSLRARTDCETAGGNLVGEAPSSNPVRLISNCRNTKSEFRSSLGRLRVPKVF